MPARSDPLTLAAIASLVAGIDQLTKLALVDAIGPGRSASRVAVLDGWFALAYVENRGAAFGFLSGLGPQLSLAAVAIVAGLLLYYVRAAPPSIWQTMAIGAIAGGALGNLIDRVRFGYVVDFLSVGAWPNFNIADCAITLGVLTLALGWIRKGSAGELRAPSPSR